jgi:hypothetical protein
MTMNLAHPNSMCSPETAEVSLPKMWEYASLCAEAKKCEEVALTEEKKCEVEQEMKECAEFAEFEK